MLFVNIPPSIETVLVKFLGMLHIPMNTEEISNELEKHPDSPTLLAVSEVLSNFRINNKAFRIEADELDQMPLPFLAFMKTDGGTTTIVTKISADYLTLHTGRQFTQIKLDRFREEFSGVVLLAEPQKEFSTSKIILHRLATLKVPIIIAGLTLIAVWGLLGHTSFLSDASWQSAVLGVFKTGGLIVCILLLIQSIDNNNPLIQNLCQNGGKKDCNAVLASNAANVFPGLSWSEVGFFYFASTLLLLLAASASLASWQILAVMNFVSLPYTIYSINYQFKAKKWCVLCCSVQALLWLEFIPLLFHTIEYPFSEAVWSFRTIADIFTCLSLPVLGWMILKPILLKVQQVKPLRFQIRNFKYSAELFNKMLADQPKFIQPDMQWSMVLGNRNAATTITMVTSPYCPPCAKMHGLLGELLEQNGDLQARIIFTADDDDRDPKTHVARHLMAISARGNEQLTLKAMHDWYQQEQKDYATWAKSYPVELIEEDFYKIGLQKSWCEMVDIHATPTMMINGSVLPSLYQLPDLKYMLQ